MLQSIDIVTKNIGFLHQPAKNRAKDIDHRRHGRREHEEEEEQDEERGRERVSEFHCYSPGWNEGYMKMFD